MNRVAAQGDTRPMAASREAMADLRRILAGRAAFYAKADATLDTSRQERGREPGRAGGAWPGEPPGRSRSNMEAKFMTPLDGMTFDAL